MYCSIDSQFISHLYCPTVLAKGPELPCQWTFNGVPHYAPHQMCQIRFAGNKCCMARFPFWMQVNLSPGQGDSSSSIAAPSGRGLRLRSGHDLQFCVHQPRPASIVIFREFLHVLAFHLHRSSFVLRIR